MAITFFNAPAISTPNTSPYVYILKKLQDNAFYTNLEVYNF